MSLASRRRTAQSATGQVAAAGAAGTVFAGTALETSKFEPGTLMARVLVTIGTGSLTFAPSWQVSDDNSTWENVKVENNAANVAATATTTLHLVGPKCLSGKKWVRASVLSAGATAASGDFTNFSYSYLMPSST